MSERVRLMMKLRREKHGGFPYSIRSTWNPLDSETLKLTSSVFRHDHDPHLPTHPERPRHGLGEFHLHEPE